MAYILSSQNVRIAQSPASFAARFGASAIDFLLIFVVNYLFTSMGFYRLFDEESTMLIGIIVYFLPLSYPLIAETLMSGQTLGKRIFHIRVVTIEGGGPKLTSLILRWLMLPFDLIGAMGLGELCIFFTKRQQRLGDLIAGTWVVRTQTYETEHIDLSYYEFPKDYVVTYPKAKNLTPQQISVISDALEHRYSSEISVAIYDLSVKVQKIVGEKQEEAYEDFLLKVTNDYRFEVAK